MSAATGHTEGVVSVLEVDWAPPYVEKIDLSPCIGQSFLSERGRFGYLCHHTLHHGSIPVTPRAAGQARPGSMADTCGCAPLRRTLPGVASQMNALTDRLWAGRSMSPVVRPGDHGWNLGGQPLPNQCLSRPATGGKFGRENIISRKERLGVGKQKETGAGVSKSFVGFKAPIEPLIAPIPR